VPPAQDLDLRHGQWQRAALLLFTLYHPRLCGADPGQRL